MAHEYGWSKREILESVYLDELYALIEHSRVRKIQEYKMQLTIVSNPHVKDPKKLYNILLEQERLSGEPVEADFDKDGFDVLKARLGASPHFVVK